MMVVVVDHDSGRLVWAAPGRDTRTVGRFFDELGERAAQLTHVSADGADWDRVGGRRAGAAHALWKNPENLTGAQQAKLDWIEKTHPYLSGAWLLKEGLRLPFQLKGQDGKDAIEAWLKWAARCRISEFVQLGRKIRRHLPAIHATLDHGLSNGRIESVNTKVRVITRMAFGFRNPAALIALAMLALAGLRPALPGR